VFLFHERPPPKLYTLSLHDALPIWSMITKISDAGATHPLAAIVEDLDELNIYCRRYHHAENPHAATESIDETELTAYVGRTLRRSEEHTSELQSLAYLVCRLLLEKK